MRKIFPILACLSLMMSCKNFSFMSFHEEPVAVVGRKSLYMNDIKNIFRRGMSSHDSLRLLQAHVDSWVKTQIKIQEAEKMLAGKEDDVEALIEAYRNSLLIYRYDRALSDLVDTTVTTAQITDYYSRNKEQFRLVGPVVKARILAFPSDYRQGKALKEMMASHSAEDYSDLVDIVGKSSFYFKEYTDRWYYFKDVLEDIPFDEKDFDAFLKKKSLYEFKDEKKGVVYLMSIQAYRNTGDYIPVVMIVPTVKTAIVNRRRADLIKHNDDSLYNSAMRSRHASLSIDTMLMKRAAVSSREHDRKQEEMALGRTKEWKRADM